MTQIPKAKRSDTTPDAAPGRIVQVTQSGSISGQKFCAF